MNGFYLVQRLTRRDLQSASGFDAFFGCQYMGSAEFEWGALPESLKRIRGARELGIHKGSVTRNDVTADVWVVGDVKVIDTIPDRLTEWLRDRYPRGKELTYFPELVDGSGQDWHRADAWWSLSDDVLWALNAETAADLLRAVTA